MESQVTVVRIYLKESDHGRRKSLMEEVLNILHDQHRVHGVVVFRGIAGFGSKGAFHAADILRLMVDLPIVVEFYDEPAVAQPESHCCRSWCRPGTSFTGKPLVQISAPPRRKRSYGMVLALGL